MYGVFFRWGQSEVENITAEVRPNQGCGSLILLYSIGHFHLVHWCSDN